VDGFAYNREELLGAARRLDEAASAGWSSPGWCAAGSAVGAALGRLDSAWTDGHRVLVGDATAARDGLLRVMSTSAAADAASAERLDALRTAVS
jgi:hypothetical protein